MVPNNSFGTPSANIRLLKNNHHHHRRRRHHRHVSSRPLGQLTPVTDKNLRLSVLPRIGRFS
jgi:hypothetical protein